MEIEIGNANEVEIDINNQDDVEVEADTQVYKNDTFHNNLKNLDYEHSGHTGFQPAGNYVTEEELDAKGYLTELPEGTVIDSNYVHTDNNFDNQRKNKLDNLENYDDTEIKEDIANLEENKVDKEKGKGLSANDFTNAYKEKVDNNTSERHTHTNKETLDNIDDIDIANWNNKAETSDIPTNLSELSEDTTHRTVSDTEKQRWNNKSDFSGNYNDLSNKPTIPDKLKDLSDDTTHRTVTDTEKSTWNNKSDFSGDYNDLENKPSIPSEVTEQTVANWGFTKNTGTYSKPSGGIPKTDLDSNVQSSLNKADSALQEHQDISGKLDTSKVKNTASTTVGDVYDVTYINTMIGDIETILTRLTTGSGV